MSKYFPLLLSIAGICIPAGAVSALDARASLPACNRGQVLFAKARQDAEKTTLLTGLYDGEEIQMPDVVLNEVGALNEKLKAVLSEQDYLAILKGELAWYVSKKTQGKKMAFSELKKLLNDILKDPTNERVFRWPRFLSNNAEGVRFVQQMGRNDYLECGYADDRYCFTVGGEIQSMCMTCARG